MRELLLLLFVGVFGHVTGDHCYPGMQCWPQYQNFIDFMKKLDGDAFFAASEEYQKLTTMINTRVTRMPYLIVLVETTQDIVECIKFANRFRIRITIRSSGHDYIGRSTADGSLQINMLKMRKITYDWSTNRNAAGEVTVESGASWIEVYNSTHDYGRSIVGGSAHTVSMGGYTLGGGHSPIGRMFGMAVDNLLGVEMVTANGSIVHANETTTIMLENGKTSIQHNGDLFWALRGGGGSTYGVVTRFTYRLHFDSPMVSMFCIVPYINVRQEREGEVMAKAFNQLLSTSLASEWGGYEIISGQFDPVHWTRGSVLLFMNHYGKWGSPSFKTMMPFYSKYSDKCTLTNHTSFLNYEVNAHDALYYKTYIMNVLMQPDSFTDDFYEHLFNFTTHDLGVEGGTGCTGALIGGHMHDTKADATAVNPYFRSAVMSLSCGMSWSEEEEENHVKAAEKLTADMLNYGHGTYFNEPSAFLPNWKVSYWGGHYDRLLAIKEKWDPQNVFSCYHCVGSDQKDGLTQHPSTIVGK